MGFGLKMLKVMYWFYEKIVMLDGEITNSWALVKLTRQGGPISALLYAIVTRPLLSICI